MSLIGIVLFGYMRGVLYVLWCVVGFMSSCLGDQSHMETTSHVGGLVNYADVRTRVARSLPEKAHEIADFIDVLQELSQATTEAADKISAHCA